jgi:aspartate aminotransferase
MSFSPNIARLQPSATIAVSTLARTLKAEGRDIIDLSAGEPDFPTPAWIAEAGIRAIQEGRTRYTPAPGIPELRAAVASNALRHAAAGWTLEGAQVVVSNGAKQALFNACFSLFGPGDQVIVAAPYWTSYPEIVWLTGADTTFVAGDEARDFRLTPDDLERVRTPATRGLILGSPSNPSGVVYGRDELTALAEWARAHDITIISDEIYRRIYFGAEGAGEGAEGIDGGEAPGLFQLNPESLGRWVVVDGVSKAYAMTGWRIGYSISPPDVAAKIAALQSQTTSNPSAPAQYAALAALADPDRADAEIRTMVQAFRRRRNLVVEGFRAHLPHLPVLDPGGAFYLFFRVDGTFTEKAPNSASWCSQVLESTGVALVPGIAFGDDRFARLSFATSDDLLEEAIRRLAVALPAR